ncbi:MAG: hypothetical protein IJK02_05280 [Clostridia bacterium]|nr:hypothetical protein [Clostridia bacterium]
MDFSNAWNAFAGKLAELLPQSPTLDSDALAEVARFAGYINFIFPVGKFLLFVAATLAAIAIYYLAMVILRWIKLIG